VEILSGVEHGVEGVGKRAGDGVVAGFIKVGGRRVAVYAHDPTFLGGSLGSVGIKKLAHLYRLALRQGVPVVGFSDSSGARLQEGPLSLMAVGELFQAIHDAVGRIPMVTAVVGGCVGGAAYSAVLGDFVIGCTNSGYMFINGPRAVKHFTGKDVSVQELGGVELHARLSGAIDLLASDEAEAVNLVRRILSYLPSNHLEQPPTKHSNDPHDRECRLQLDEVYDVRSVVLEIFDVGSVLELKQLYAPNIFTGLARLDGVPVGVVANQPKHMQGCIDIHAARKVSKFIRICSSFNIPLVTLVDTAGFAAGPEQELNGLVQSTSKIFTAYQGARVPKVSVLLGKAYGGAYIAMCSKGLGADYVIGLERSEVAVLQPELAAEIIFRKQLETLTEDKRREEIAKYAGILRERFSGEKLLALGVVDTVVEPEQLRRSLARVVKDLFESYVKKIRADHRPQHTV
jgi:acetyl-CoA carboxylase carboxyltransferase component